MIYVLSFRFRLSCPSFFVCKIWYVPLSICFEKLSFPRAFPVYDMCFINLSFICHSEITLGYTSPDITAIDRYNTAWAVRLRSVIFISLMAAHKIVFPNRAYYRHVASTPPYQNFGKNGLTLSQFFLFYYTLVNGTSSVLSFSCVAYYDICIVIPF